MQPSQLRGDRVEIGDDFVPGQPDVPGDMGGQCAIASAGQQLGAAPEPAVAVQRDGDVHVVEKSRQLGRLGRIEP